MFSCSILFGIQFNICILQKAPHGLMDKPPDSGLGIRGSSPFGETIRSDNVWNLYRHVILKGV